MSKRRRIAAMVAVLVLIVLAGCIGPFADSGLSDDTLDAEADYDWSAEADAAIVVDIGEFAAVYQLDGDTTVELSYSSYYRDQAVDIEAVRYRFPNGTELTGSELDIGQSRSTTTIEVPDGNGTLAFTAPAGSKTVEIPGLVDGTYEVALPSDHRVGNFFLSDVSPSASNDELDGNRQVLTWSDNSGDIAIRFYLWRDHYLFYGLIIGSILAGAVGTLYFRRQISELAKRRRELAGELEDAD